LAASASQSDTAPKKKSPVAREKKRATDPPMPAADSAQSKQDLEVGAKTGKWMMGQLSSEELDWSDDAAARRAVAGRNHGPPNASPARGTPMVTPLAPNVGSN